jgi:hypothetical protein
VPWGNGVHYAPGNAVIDTAINATSYWLNTYDHTSAAAGSFAADRAAHPGYWVATSPTAATTARFSYLDKNPIATAAAPTGPFAERFVSDTDVFRLPERLLKLGMVWQWKANKGSPYAEDMGTWSDAMANAMGADAPSPIIIGGMPSSSAANVAYPFPIDPGMVPL